MQLNNNNLGLSGKARYVLLSILAYFISFSGFTSSFDSRGFNLSNDKTKTVIPFKFINNLIVIPAKINSDIEVNLVFDTGVRSLVLFGSHFKKSFEMTSREVPLAGYGKNKTKTATLSLENDVYISDVEGHGIGVLIAPDRYFFPKGWEVSVHGLIGYQIFSRFVVKIDYPNRVIVLTEPDKFIPPKGLISKPLLVKDTKPYIPLTFQVGNLKQEDAYFHVDTGSSRELILFLKGDEYSKLRMKRCYIGKGISGKLFGFKSANAFVELADSDNVSAEVYLYRKEFSDKELADSYGTLGSGLFGDYTITFDYVNSKFYIKPEFNRMLIPPKLAVDIFKYTG